jgi:tripartite motif-containing protein 71
MKETVIRKTRGASTILAAAMVLGLASMVAVPFAARAQACAPTAPVCIQPVGTIGLTSSGQPVCACAGLYGWGAATEPDGSVLIGDYWNFRIQHYSETGALMGTAVPPGAHLAPYGIAVDRNDGSIYFGDVDHSPPDVQKYSATGQFLYAITTPKTGKFNYPARVAVASDGTVFVSDMRAHVIDVFSNTGTALQTFGSKGSGTGQFNSPRGIAVDASNNLYVADNYNSRIQEFTESGTFIRQFGSKGTGPGQFGPTADLRGVAIDNARGFIYVADKASGYVNQYSLSTGAYTGVRFGGYGAANGKFGDGPRETTVDGAGNVWVGDLANFRVQVFSPSGTFLRAEPTPAQPPPTGGFNGGMGVTVDGSGNVWALDRYNQRVEEFNSGGTFLMQFGKRGGGPNGMNYDRAIAYDPNDRTIYVADTDNQSIKKYDLSGNFICAVGVFGTGLGQFNEPQGLDVGSDGTVYIADSLNQRIQVLAPNSCTPSSTFGTKGTNPDGNFLFVRSVEVDPTDGTLWTVDQTLGVVEHFSTTGQWLNSFGSKGSATNQFNQPSDIVLDGNYVFISDTATHNIKIWTKQGQFVEAYGGFGTALGKFKGPYGMAFAPDGNLYVMEQQNDRIQILSVTLGA